MLHLILGSLVLLSVAHLSFQQGSVVPMVETSLGKISGTIMKSQSGNDIYAFRGIRYAEAPIGDLRFKNPVPVKPWDGTFEAKEDSLICPQTGSAQYMSEDCLKINVYTRDLAGNQSVLVYIHGGANVLGSGSSIYEAGPQYLLDHDIVLVSFNYRLGALGFLYTDSEEAPGNFGYLDQVLALQWVQEHISQFGGNKDSVTIFGLSAGAIAVSLHMASKLSTGLFHRAIAMSGSATNQFAIDNLYWTRKLAREISCPMYNPEDVVACLRSKDWKDIIDVCSRWEPYGFINMKWNYEIDGHFLEKHPIRLFVEGDINKVPLLTGITKNELDFTLYHQEDNTGLLNDISINFNLYGPEMFLYDPEEDDTYNPPKSKQIQKFYYPNGTDINKENLEQLGEAFSDGIIGHGVHTLVNLARRRMPVYYYRMDYVGQSSLYENADGKPRGVGHADDIHYIMPGSWYGAQMQTDDPDLFMMKRLTALWVSFAKDGQPSFEESVSINWTPSNETNLIALYNNKDVSLGDAPYPERYELWDRLFPDALSGSSTIQISIIASILSMLLWFNMS